MGIIEKDKKKEISVDIKLSGMCLDPSLDLKETVYIETITIAPHHALISTNKPKSVYSLLSIKLFIPYISDGELQSEQEIINSKAIVTHLEVLHSYNQGSEPLCSELLYGMGIYFIDMGESDRQKIINLIDTLSSKDKKKESVEKVEKRVYPRISTRLPVLFLGDSLDLRDIVYSEIVNISLEGIFVVAKDDVKVNTDIGLRFFISNGHDYEDYEDKEENILISCKGIILRIEALNNNFMGNKQPYPYGIGVRLLDINKQLETKLYQFINRGINSSKDN